MAAAGAVVSDLLLAVTMATMMFDDWSVNTGGVTLMFKNINRKTILDTSHYIYRLLRNHLFSGHEVIPHFTTRWQVSA